MVEAFLLLLYWGRLGHRDGVGGACMLFSPLLAIDWLWFGLEMLLLLLLCPRCDTVLVDNAVARVCSRVGVFCHAQA